MFTKRFNLTKCLISEFKKTIMSEKIEMTFISLNDHLLLNIFKFLNWIDSINLAATCNRMKNLKYWVGKENQEFDLNKYVEKATVPIGSILTVIGPYIRAAKIIDQEVISKSFMEKCYNIKSLKIDGCISKSAAIALNTWMKELKIERLYIGHLFEQYVEELLHGIEGLNTFVFDSFDKLLPSDFFNKNSAIEHLLLKLPDDDELSLDLSSLLVLHSLQSLYITILRTDDLDDVRKYVKVDHLNAFSICILEVDWDAGKWDNFAKYLAENSKLDKLQMKGCINIDEQTFSTLKLLNLTSLWLGVRFSWEDCVRFSWENLHESAAPRLKYLRLEWRISWCSSAKIGHILKMFTTVEVICLSIYDGPLDLLVHFKDEFFGDILKISDNRPGLKLHIFSSEICFNFVSKRYNIIEGKKYCSCKDSFPLSDSYDDNPASSTYECI